MSKENIVIPKTPVFISKVFYNTLVSILEVFIESEKLIGETDYSKNAKALYQKIYGYARTYIDNNGNENVAVYFYPKESALLIELLLSALSLQKSELDKKKNYYEKLKKRKPKNE
jgi:prolipoprotein diacylglyceryltransferase